VEANIQAHHFDGSDNDLGGIWYGSASSEEFERRESLYSGAIFRSVGRKNIRKEPRLPYTGQVAITGTASLLGNGSDLGCHHIIII
jgi:hypothetical protein